MGRGLWFLVAAGCTSAASTIACGALLAFSDDDPGGGGARASGGADAAALDGGGGTQVPAGDPTDGSTSLPCPPAAIWCEPFDDGFTQWTGVTSAQTIVGGVVDHGNVAHVSVPAGNGKTVIRRGIADSASLDGIRLSFSVRVKDPGYTAPSATSNYAVATLTGSGLDVGFFLDENGSPPSGSAHVTVTTSIDSGFSYAQGQFMTYGAWHRVFMELRLGTGASVKYGVVGGSSASVASVSGAKRAVSVELGVWRPNDATPAIEVDLDDVIVEPF